MQKYSEYILKSIQNCIVKIQFAFPKYRNAFSKFRIAFTKFKIAFKKFRIAIPEFRANCSLPSSSFKFLGLREQCQQSKSFAACDIG